jgi:hypothetical protein
MQNFVTPGIAFTNKTISTGLEVERREVLD